MKKPKVQQKTERRISAALRLVLVAVLLLAQIALVLVLNDLLRQRMAIAYTLLELVALAYVFRINSRPGGGSYKLGWTLLILTVPVVGLILYWLWNGDHPQKRLDLQKLPRPRESDARQEHSRLQVEHLRREHPEWGRLAAYLDRQGFPLYTGTGAVYLPTGEAYLEDLLERMEQQANEMKQLRQALDKLKAEASLGEAKQFLASAKTVKGLHVITTTRTGMDTAAMRTMGDFLRDKDPSVVAVIASINGEKVSFLAVCGKEAVARGIKAGDLVRAVSAVCGGKGGGKPDSAMGGGTELLKVDDALASVDDFVSEKLS